MGSGFLSSLFIICVNYDIYTADLKDKNLFHLILADLSSTVPFGLNCFILLQYWLHTHIIRVRYVAIHLYLKTSLMNREARAGKSEKYYNPTTSNSLG